MQYKIGYRWQLLVTYNPTDAHRQSNRTLYSQPLLSFLLYMANSEPLKRRLMVGQGHSDRNSPSVPCHVSSVADDNHWSHIVRLRYLVYTIYASDNYMVGHLAAFHGLSDCPVSLRPIWSDLPSSQCSIMLAIDGHQLITHNLTVTSGTYRQCKANII